MLQNYTNILIQFVLGYVERAAENGYFKFEINTLKKGGKIKLRIRVQIRRCNNNVELLLLRTM